MESCSSKRHFAIAANCAIALSVLVASPIATAQTSELTLALGEPQTLFSSPDLTSPRDITAVDVNADGREDVVFLAGTPDAAAYLLLNTGAAAGTLQQIGETAKYERLRVGDMNGDGPPDVVVAGRDTSTKIFINRGGAQPFDGATVHSVGDANRWSRGLAIADVNGDSFPDIALANIASTYPAGNDLYLSSGAAAPFAGAIRRSIGADDVSAYRIAFADVNGDGRQDALLSSVDIVNGFSGQNAGIRIYLNNGSSDPFGGVTPTFINTNRIDTAFAVEDLNADTRPDLALATGSGPLSEWSIFLHSGSAGEPYNASAPLWHSQYVSSNCTDVLISDVNGDGRPDIAIGCSGGGIRPYRPVRTSGALFINGGGANPFANAAPVELPAKVVQPSAEPVSAAASMATVPFNGRSALLVAGGEFTSQPATIELYPLIDDRRPTANDDRATTSVGAAINIDVLANDMDPDGTIARDSVEVTVQAANGACSFDTAANTFAYAPAPGYIGADVCQYRVKDNLGAYSNSAAVSVTVANNNVDRGGGGGGSLSVIAVLILTILPAVRLGARKT